MATPAKRKPQPRQTARSAPVRQTRHGLLRILLTIAVMTAAGAALGVLVAHIGH
jgi:hypothetical protein